MVAATLVVPVDMSALGFGVWLLLKRWVILDEIVWALTRRRVKPKAQTQRKHCKCMEITAPC